LRGIKGKVAAVLVGVVIVALALAAASASAEVLVSQPPGPSGVAVPAVEIVPWGGNYDDFIVPGNGHWHLEAIRVFGTATAEHPRTFNVRIYSGGGRDDRPVLVEPEQVFQERVTVAGGPDYLIPIEGAPRLDASEILGYPSYWWISVQAENAEGNDDWSWLTGPDTPGTAPFYAPEQKPAGAEPGLAFELLGAATQTVTAQVSGPGTLVSNPPGISCPGTCKAEFPRGTGLTFSANPENAAMKFTEWGFRNTGYSGPPNALSPIVIPSPCKGIGGCAFTLTEDTHVGAVFEPNDEIDVLRVVRDRRAGRGQLLTWVPGPGTIGVFSQGLRPDSIGMGGAGVGRIPLVPTKEITKALRKKGHATVFAEVSFQPTGATTSATVAMHLTLVRKAPRRAVHKPAHRVH
jgi:hypothetical protein